MIRIRGIFAKQLKNRSSKNLYFLLKDAKGNKFRPLASYVTLKPKEKNPTKDNTSESK